MPRKAASKSHRSARIIAGLLLAGLIALLASLGVQLPGVAGPRDGATASPAQLAAGAIVPVIHLNVPPAANEAAWTTALAQYLAGQPEARVEFGRIDVLTDTYAIEIDFLRKWKEGVGQSLHYAAQTGKTACLALIVDEFNDEAQREIAYIDKLCTEKSIKLILLQRTGT